MRSATPFKPTAAALQAAYGRAVPDLIAPGLRVLFVGINPGLYSAAVGHHFARPGNRFWPALHQSGFTERLLSPFEEAELLRLGLGVTNVVRRATASAAELDRAELIAGGRLLAAKARRLRPGIIAVLGVGAYQAAFDRKRVAIGPQRERLGGARLWVLPNPSGLNANYQLDALVRLFRALRRASARP